MNSFNLYPRVFTANEKTARNTKNKKIVLPTFAPNKAGTSAQLSKLGKLTAIGLILPPNAQNSNATITIPSPSQTAHQSSFFHSSDKPPEGSVLFSAIMTSPFYFVLSLTICVFPTSRFCPPFLIFSYNLTDCIKLNISNYNYEPY